MTKIVVEIELDQAEYDKEHGPGTVLWRKCHGEGSYGWTPEREQTAKEGYAKNNSQHSTAEAVVDVLREGFYDWSVKGWLRLEVQGHTVCKDCGGVDRHKDWCASIAGPEASET